MKKPAFLILIILSLLVPALAVPGPVDITNWPPGGVMLLYTSTPYIVVTPDPTIVDYECQIDVDPGFPAPIETITATQLIGPGANTIQSYTFTNIVPNPKQAYFIQCRGDDQIPGPGSWGPYGMITEFSFVADFDQRCAQESGGIILADPQGFFSFYTPPDGTTPYNRTVFQKQNCLEYAYASSANVGAAPIKAIEFQIHYNDTVFNVTDFHNLTNLGTPTTLALQKNSFCFQSPIDSHNTGQKKYEAELWLTTAYFNQTQCQLNWTYAMNLNPNLSTDPGNPKLATILAMALFIIAISAGLFIGGLKRKKGRAYGT